MSSMTAIAIVVFLLLTLLVVGVGYGELVGPLVLLGLLSVALVGSILNRRGPR